MTRSPSVREDSDWHLSFEQERAEAEAEVARQQRSVQLVGARVREGLVTGQDLAQQQSQLTAAEAAILADAEPTPTRLRLHLA